jgi:hypothetical protein
MTRTISLIIGIAVVALVAVPTAFGEGRLAGSNEQSGQSNPVGAYKLQVRSEGLTRFERRESGISAHGIGEFAPTVNSKDANEHVDLPTAPESVPVATSGREVEWPQIGIGFGIGIALAIVLGLLLKATRPRTLAH